MFHILDKHNTLDELNRVKWTDKLCQKVILWAVPHWIRPNWITMIRLVVMPPLIAWALLNHRPVLALVFFLIGLTTDWMDGAMARTRNQITTAGKILDPVADKLILAVVLLMVALPLLPHPLVWFVVLLDVLIMASGFFGYLMEKSQLHANWWGKLKFIVYGVATVAVFLFASTDWRFFYWTSISLFIVGLVSAVASLRTRGI